MKLSDKKVVNLLREQKENLASLVEAHRDQYPGVKTKEETAAEVLMLLKEILQQLKALVYYRTPSTGALADVEGRIGSAFVTENKTNTTIKELVREVLEEQKING